MDEDLQRVPPILNPAIDYFLTNGDEQSPTFLLEKAKIEYFTGNFIECFRTYSKYFDFLMEPNTATEDVQDQYIYCVLNLGEIEQNRNKNFLQAIYYYLHAINMKLNNSHLVLNALGVCLLKEGQTKSAKLYFEEALKLKPDYSAAAKNLQELCYQRFSRQQCVINDKLRWETYLNAIMNVVKDKNVKTMLEIYCGAGYISYYASQNIKDICITAIEPKWQYFKMAKDLLNNCGVDVVCSNLNQFKETKSFDLIVMQLFNDSFFDKFILDDLANLFSRFGDQITIIPIECDLFITGIQCDNLIKDKRLLNFIPELKLVDICVTSTNISKEFESLSINNENVQYLTRSANIFKFNLKNSNFLRTLKNASRGKSISKDLCLKVLQDGVLHAFAVWTDFHLYKDFIISNNPKSQDHFESASQVIYYLDHPIVVKAGQNLEIKVEYHECKLKFNIYNFPNKCCDCFKVQQHLITFLNDIELVNTYKRLADFLIKNKFKKVLESTNFPLASLFMAKKGMQVYYKPTLFADLNFLDHVIDLNKICKDKFIILDKKYGDLQYPSTFDVEITEATNSLGILNEIFRCGNEVNIFPRKLSLPQKVFLRFVLINSSYLEESLNQESLTEITLEESQFRKISSVGSVQLRKRNFTQVVNLNMLETNRINGIYYWYEMEYFKNIKYSTLNSPHYKKNCVVLENSSVFEIHSKVSISISLSAEEFRQFQIKYSIIV